MKWFNKKLIFSISLLLTTTTLFSQENYTELVDSIGDELSRYEKLATKTKRNIHYQPYIISVITAKTINNLGFTTLKDALEIVPGLEFTSDNVSYRKVIFRGSNPTSFGQSKLFIDGVLVNNIYFDGYSEYLDMPVELIERIEVIRGAGSKTNTTTSYAGSINVITYANACTKSEDRLFGKFGTNSYKMAGFRKNYQVKELSIFSDFYYQEHDKKVFTKSNGLKSGIFNFPHLIDNTHLSSASNVPLWLKNYSLGISAKYNNIYFNSRFYEYKQSTAFGLNYIQSLEDDSLKLPNHYMLLGYKKDFKDFIVDTKVGTNYNSSEANSKVVSDGVKLPRPTNPALIVTFPNGMYSINKAKQKSIYHATTVKYLGFDKHQITSSYHISKTQTYEVVSKITNRETGIGMVDYTNTSPFFDKDAMRKTYLFSLEDKYGYSESLQLLSSLTYENNTHISSKLNPKLSLVYHDKNSNIFKILYSKSHRTPSWQELYTMNNYSRVGNKNLKAEEIETIEASYIKHFSHDNFLQTSIFHIKNKNQIHNMTSDNQYANSDKDNLIDGIEIEYKGNLTPKDSLYLNLSYIDGENSYDKTLSGASNILFKGYYIYNLQENLSLSTVVKYSSDKDRILADGRDKIKSTTVVDATLSYKNFLDNYNISLAVKNLFDTDVVYASKPDTYEDDYPEVGRSFILSFSKKI